MQVCRVRHRSDLGGVCDCKLARVRKWRAAGAEAIGRGEI